jgi:hypothetical protein
MKTAVKLVAGCLALACAYGLGYYHRSTNRAADAYDLRITVAGSEDEQRLDALKPGDVFSVEAMEVTVRNETAPDKDAQFPHLYGTTCPLKEADPVRVVGAQGERVLVEVIERSPDGLFHAGDRYAVQTYQPGVTRTVFYCPVGTLVLMDRHDADIRRVTHLSASKTRQAQTSAASDERELVRSMLQQGGVR